MLQLNKKKHPEHDHLIIYRDGRVYSTKSNKFLKPQLNSNGYHIVHLFGKKKARVHRLVAETFLTDSEYYGLDVNHKNGTKTDNYESNLEWCTRSHNIRHAHETGLNTCHSEGHHYSIYTDDFVRSVCKMMEDGWRNKEISEELSLSKDWVSMVRSGRLWVNISKDFNINCKRNNRVSLETVHFICKSLQDGITEKELTSPPHNLARSTVGRIRRRESFLEISKDYSY